MNVYVLTQAPPAELAAALAEFEAQFTYPLGNTLRFRIDHGPDYSAFFRSIGPGCCVVAVDAESVIGVVGAALRTVRLADGREITAAFLGDLKLASTARSGVVLRRLIRTITTWIGNRAELGIGVVMAGTAVTPEHYTGRVGIPGFAIMGELCILRLACSPGPTPDRCTNEIGLAVHSRFQRSGVSAVPLPTTHEPRSAMPPQWFARADGFACGRVEDTDQVKRLITTTDIPLRSAHVSAFAYAHAAAGADLLRQAAAWAGQSGHEGLFVAVPALEAQEIIAALATHADSPLVTCANAMVYGHGLHSDAGMNQTWWLDTADM